MVTRTNLYINGKDAYATWGLQLDGGDQSGYDALLAPKSFKEPVTNKNVTAQGAVVVCGTGLKDERTVNVPVHIVASSYAEFREKKAKLERFLEYGSAEGEADVTPKGKLTIVVKREWRVPGTDYNTEETEFESVMYCLSINNYSQFSQVQNKIYNWRTWQWVDVDGTGYGIAKFILVLYEPNEPTI